LSRVVEQVLLDAVPHATMPIVMEDLNKNCTQVQELHQVDWAVFIALTTETAVTQYNRKCFAGAEKLTNS